MKGPRNKTGVSIEIQGQPLERVRQIKYLGVIIDGIMSFVKHVDDVTQKAKRK